MQAVLRLPTVRSITGLSRSSIYLRIAQGTFPRPVKLGSRAVGWLQTEIAAWVDDRIKASKEAKQ